MLKTFKAGDGVGGGFYFNANDWTMHVVPREGEVLKGAEGTKFYGFPTLFLVAAAPLLSFVFVIFLPFIGLALMAKAAVDKAALLYNARVERKADELGAVVDPKLRH